MMLEISENESNAISTSVSDPDPDSIRSGFRKAKIIQKYRKDKEFMY